MRTIPIALLVLVLCGHASAEPFSYTLSFAELAGTYAVTEAREFTFSDPQFAPTVIKVESVTYELEGFVKYPDPIEFVSPGHEDRSSLGVALLTRDTLTSFSPGGSGFPLASGSHQDGYREYTLGEDGSFRFLLHVDRGFSAEFGYGEIQTGVLFRFSPGDPDIALVTPGEVDLRRITVTIRGTPIPEPVSMLLLAAGGLLVGSALRSRY